MYVTIGGGLPTLGCFFVHVPGTPNDLFLKVNPSKNKAFSDQKKGHLGSRYLYPRGSVYVIFADIYPKELGRIDTTKIPFSSKFPMCLDVVFLTFFWGGSEL